MGIRELRQEASKLGVKNYSRLNNTDLEAAVNAAKGATLADMGVFNGAADSVATLNGQIIGEVNGCVVMVNPSDSAETVGRMLGSYSKSDARKIRRLMYNAGMKQLACVPRICSEHRAAKAA